MNRMKPGPAIDALAAAYLFAHGKKQADIAGSLGVSQSKVSRQLRHGSDYIEKKSRFREELLDEETLQQVLWRASPHELREKLKAWAARHHQPPPTVHFTAAAGDDREAFGSQAATVVSELLRNATGTVGVAWGNTLWHTIQALRQSPRDGALRHHDPLEIVPLCGDPLMDSDEDEAFADRTSSRIASELNRIVNGDTRRSVWLGLVPAFIPRTFHHRDTRVIRRYVDLVPQYRRVFGNPSLGSKLHMILTAAGSAQYPVSIGRSVLLGLDKEEASLLRRSVYGNVAGVLLPRHDEMPPGGGALVRELTEHWTGLTVEHLRACAAAAFQAGNAPKRPGVTVLSFREDQAEIILEAIRQGLVNQLIISPELEKALEARLALVAATEPTAGSVSSDQRFSADSDQIPSGKSGQSNPTSAARTHGASHNARIDRRAQTTPDPGEAASRPHADGGRETRRRRPKRVPRKT
jgi:DNA-binding transcriptional regulator LsrR (DeoR family)